MIKLNGQIYDVELLKLQRSIKKTYKYDIYTEDGKRHTEIKAIYPVRSITIGNMSPVDYDKFYTTLLSSTTLNITLPKNHTEDETLEVTCDSFTDALEFTLPDGSRWFEGMSLTLTGTNPI